MTTMRTRVLIVEDQAEFLRRFSDAVLADDGLSLTGAVASGRAARALLDAEPPDVMLVDLGLPDLDGTELIRYAAARHPGCDCLVVSMFADDAHVMAALEAGATGYLLKDARSERIAAAVHEVRAGGSPISPSIARRVLERFRRPMPGLPNRPAAVVGGVAGGAGPAGSVAAAAPSPLSERETEILQLVAKGFSFDTVGEVLSISPHTVVAHVKKIYRKLAVHSRGEAVYEASQMGLL
jgi:DNA-binding NarL/FixJ family response regulator